MANIKPFEQAIKQAKGIFDVIKDCPVVYEKEAAFAMQILEANKYLAGMNVNSIANAIKNVALCGITLNPAMKLAYLVPRDGRACLDISYMGLIKIATDSGSVVSVSCHLVHENDFFEVEHGTQERVTHKPKPFAPRGKIIGVYCIANLAAGGVQVETMSMEDVAAIRARSKAFTSGKSCPWTTDTGEMIRKTCVKRASKYWPKTERLSKAVVTLDEHEGYKDITPEPTEPAAPVYMDDSVFNKNLSTYKKMIQSGKKTAADLIAFLNTKAELTLDQKATLNAINVDTVTDAEIVEGETA